MNLRQLAAGAADAGGPLAAALGDRLERAETAGALARASLVTVPADGRLRLHRLVQAVTRDQLDDAQAAAWAQQAFDLVSVVFPGEPQDHSSWPVCASLAPHVESVVAHAESWATTLGLRSPAIRWSMMARPVTPCRSVRTLEILIAFQQLLRALFLPGPLLPGPLLGQVPPAAGVQPLQGRAQRKPGQRRHRGAALIY
jgi:hypothetical protein